MVNNFFDLKVLIVSVGKGKFYFDVRENVMIFVLFIGIFIFDIFSFYIRNLIW